MPQAVWGVNMGVSVSWGEMPQVLLSFFLSFSGLLGKVHQLCDYTLRTMGRPPKQNVPSSSQSSQSGDIQESWIPALGSSGKHWNEMGIMLAGWVAGWGARW